MGAYKVLFVDDHPQQLGALLAPAQKYLDRQNISLHPVDQSVSRVLTIDNWLSVRERLATAKEAGVPYDIVITDLNFFDSGRGSTRDGFKIIEDVEEMFRDARPKPRVILMTAYGGSVSHDEVLEFQRKTSISDFAWLSLSGNHSTNVINLKSFIAVQCEIVDFERKLQSIRAVQARPTEILYEVKIIEEERFGWRKRKEAATNFLRLNVKEISTAHSVDIKFTGDLAFLVKELVTRDGQAVSADDLIKAINDGRNASLFKDSDGFVRLFDREEDFRGYFEARDWLLEGEEICRIAAKSSRSDVESKELDSYLKYNRLIQVKNLNKSVCKFDNLLFCDWQKTGVEPEDHRHIGHCCFKNLEFCPKSLYKKISSLDSTDDEIKNSGTARGFLLRLRAELKKYESGPGSGIGFKPGFGEVGRLATDKGKEAEHPNALIQTLQGNGGSAVTALLIE